MISFEDVDIGYGDRAVLRDLNFSIGAGEFFGIVGSNGSGKTTILRSMLGILKPLRGRIEFDGGTERRRFGYVPQRAHVDELFPLTAREIVLMGRYGLVPPGRRPGARDREIAERAVDLVGLGPVAGTWFRDLSGGQQQRTLFARALAAEAPVLLLDEPTDGMDIESQGALLELVGRLRRDTGLTIVYVTHRLNELANTAQRLLLLHAGRVRLGSADELLTPAVLRETYGREFQVAHVGGKRVIVT